jgi:hypothetical protein
MGTADPAEILGKPAFNWKAPDYGPVYQARMERLEWLREDVGRFEAIKAYYADHPADFINDWGMTYDPRNADIGLPTTVPAP